MNLEQYKNSVLGTAIDYDWVYWHQCVDLVKDYSEKVLNIPLGSFWGSALTGWQNFSNTFSVDKWDKVVNNYNDPEQVPEEWDIIFFKWWEYWHTGVVLKSYVWENRIDILEQNVGNWDGIGSDDYIEVNTYSYHKVLGWYHKKTSNTYKWIEYPKFFRWVPVIRKKSVNPRANWRYDAEKQIIIIYENWFNQDEDYRNAILLHEYAHHIFETKMTQESRDLWREISECIPHYNNKHASLNYKEDFCELIELSSYKNREPEAREVELKYKLALNLFNHFE